MLKVNDRVIILGKSPGSFESLPFCKWKKEDMAYIQSEPNYDNHFYLKKTLTGCAEYGLFSPKDVRKINNEQERLNFKYGIFKNK